MIRHSSHWFYWVLAALLFTGCAAFSSPKPITCGATIHQSKDLLGNETKDTSCTCEFPQQKGNLIDAGGILGGLISLFNGD